MSARVAWRAVPRASRPFAVALVVLGLLALASAPLPGEDPERRVGALLLAAAGLEIVHGFRRRAAAAQRDAWFGGTVTLFMGLLLMNAPFLAGTALVIFLAGWFAVDAVRYALSAARAPAGRTRLLDALAAAGNLALVLVLFALKARSAAWAVAVAGGLRILGEAWNVLRYDVRGEGDVGETVAADLGAADAPELAALAERFEEEARMRGPVDRGWIAAFLVTLFAIHLGRMGLDRTPLGIVAPTVAVLGDVCAALAVAFLVAVPFRVLTLELLRPLERRLWPWCLEAPSTLAKRLVRRVLESRLRAAVRLRSARYSVRIALRNGLRIGLPVAAVLTAIIPVLGMSWYFDTENWAAGMWDSWAAARTDGWREAMTRAVVAAEMAAGRPGDLRLDAPGTEGDFAFVVIGDTGEGDASQHVLRDSLIAATAQPEVRFVLVSSDVVYPTGEMKDYERKFWLPFKGVTKPVYAIPGNHDWYDALDGFTATFFTPEAARTALRARAEADKHLTATTEGRVAELVSEAARLRREYGVPTGFQAAVYFQIQAPAFALLAVDTGVRKGIDPDQRAWLERALEASRGKFVMALLGHPLYAVGEDMTAGNSDFADIRALLRRHDVPLVMAGDTHDLEWYVEARPSGRTMFHMVNGGGGAYLSLGTALAKPERMPTAAWAFYPATAPIVAKVDALTPFWKRPFWFWTRTFNGWPWTAEWLSAAFDYNVAPFFQSFVEVRVEPSRGRLRLLPWGVHGRLRWTDLETSPGLRPAAAAPDAPAEWVLPLGAPPSRGP
jgi:uncharacterized membrane protein HdeD (DUF308 family)/3',5'-cyclic AMP phosphodiesterase CpdA